LLSKKVLISSSRHTVYTKKNIKELGRLHVSAMAPWLKILHSMPIFMCKEFQSQKELSQQAQRAGAFILPSRYEPWGVVVHEFACAGLPLILSEKVGARPQFLIDGANGYTFYQYSAEDLAYKMSLISTQSDEKLVSMGMLSARLAEHITPDIAAASLMSVVSKERTHA